MQLNSLDMLIRLHNGEHKVWSVVHVPCVEQEDQRQLHREMIKLKAERTAQSNSIKGLLASLASSWLVPGTPYLTPKKSGLASARHLRLSEMESRG